LAKAQKTKLYPLKFEYNVKTANVNIAQLHGRVLKAIAASHGSDVKFYDKTGEEEIKLDKLPKNQEEWSTAFHMQTVTNSRNSNSILMVGQQLAMSISISDLKSGIQTVLRQVDGFIKYNAWDKNLDSRTAGYLANLHPVHHNRDKVQRDVESFLADQMRLDNEDPDFPVFKVVPSSAGDNKSNKKISSRFLAIECRDEPSAAILRKKLMGAYITLPTKVDPILGAFIPFNAKFNDLDIFRRLVRRQNQYLANHRNIPVNGLDESILCYVLDNGNDLADEIQTKAQIFRMDPSATRDHIGRYNLSTTEDHYQTAVQWIDVELPKIIATIPADRRGEYEGCIERVAPRVHSSRSISSKNSGQSSVKSYLSVLTTFYGPDGSDEEDDIPPHVYRKNRTEPKLSFDFDKELDFPALSHLANPTPASRPSNSPHHSTKSASSSITMSELNVVRNEMQAKFEQDLKDFKEKLIAKMEREIAETVTSSVKSALAGINAQINSSLQENNKIIYSNMQAERSTVTKTMTNAVSSKVDIAVSTAVTRALEKFASSQRKTRSNSPFRKKRTPENVENVEMTDGEKNR
jgi:hypothetical protein